jgi:cellulose synthase/poly-beta-1,6-N-acetylglucosamine synthase-like glycosyltransferase
LSVLLRGTGMVFAREVLEQQPWNARSIVEDAEYSVRLYRAGWRIHFVAEASVRSQFASEKDQLAVQRGRWIGGNASFGRAHALRLMVEGLLRRRPILIDLGWTLLVVQRSLLLVQAFLALLTASLCAIVAAGTFTRVLLLVAVGLLAGHGLILVLGAIRLGLTSRRLRLLLGVPVVGVRWLHIAVTGLVNGGPVRWERTPR